MEGFVLFLFIIMVVVSVIGQANKAGSQGKPGQRPPQPRTPGRWPNPNLPPDRTRRTGERPWESLPPRSGQVGLPDPEARPQGSAADMLSEDFWRELTGQPRRAAQPAARAAPPAAPAKPAPRVPAPAEVSSWDEGMRQSKAPPPEVVPPADFRRPMPVQEPPVAVSLETMPPDPEVREAEFHRRLAREAAARKADPESIPASHLVQRLRRGEGLRESFVLAEVFGRPRGLEEDPPLG